MRRAPIAFVLLIALCLAAPVRRAAAQALSPALLEQIRALDDEKRARTPSQRKVASRLLHTAAMRRGVPIARGIAALRTDVELDASGAVLLDVRGDVTQRLLARIGELGGVVLASVPELRAARVRLPLDAVELLAELPEVRAIRPADRAMTRAINVSQGDVAHRADAARASFGVDGSGVAVGVLSDGVDALGSLQASGDLPPGVTVLPGQAGSGNEGAAMLEIVHDLAPGASLLFATAFNGQASFAANILALRAAGADVIVDDVGYFAEGVFQDDDVAAAVDAVVADGALYFSAAGNEGNLDHGTAGVWEGDFVASATTIGGKPAHDFGGGVFGDPITADSPFAFTLQWSDPLAGSGNDYDLYLLNSSATAVVAASTDVQDGNDDPFEMISSAGTNDKNRRLAVVRYSGAGRFLHLNTQRGRLAIATAGQTGGHSAARGAVSVAAVDVGSAGPGGVFDGTESVETYSSDGPRRVFYEASGAPITPGNSSATGGELRQKPDLAAADCVATAAPGFATFCGTSAAAPHAAAIAALLLDLRSETGVTGSALRSTLATTALDIEAPGTDRDAGAGIADALAATTALVPGPCEDGIDNDGDGLIDFPADPGCHDPAWQSESSQCQDGLDNDGDGLRDFDGGASAGVPPEQQTAPDPQCAGKPWRNTEKPACGLGAELVLALGALTRWIERSRIRTDAREQVDTRGPAPS